MSLSTRLLRRAAPATPRARLVPKDRGTGSAFGLRRSGTPETDEPQQIAPLRRQEEPPREEERAERRAEVPVAVPREMLNRQGSDGTEEEEELQRAPTDPAPSDEPNPDRVTRSAAMPVAKPIPVAARDTAVVAAAETVQGPQEITTEGPSLQRVSEASPEEDPAPAMRHEPTASRQLSHRKSTGAAQTGASDAPVTMMAPPALTAAAETHQVVAAPDVPAPPVPEATEPSSYQAGFAETSPTAQQAARSEPVAPQHSFFPMPPAASRPRPQAPERPQITIDQIDVIVADPHPRPAPAATARNGTSALLARRWLRR